MVPKHRLHNILDESLDSAGHSCEYVESCTHTRLSHTERKLLIHKPQSLSRCYIPARYVLAAWSFLGFINMFTLRMDLNIALLAMVDNTNGSTKSSNGLASTAATLVNVSTNDSGKFHWSERNQDIVLSAFFYGYCSTQILGGYLSGKFGAKNILGVGILVTSLLALVTPVAAFRSFYLLLLCRVLQGFAQGLAQPCMHTMWSRWAPEREKSLLMTFTYAGCQVGTVIATWATGYMADGDILGGWPLVFYVFGGAGVLWSLNWICLIHDRPETHPRISKEEKEYIEKSRLSSAQLVNVRPPWLKVLRSPALLAIVAAHFANDWGCFALTTCLPSYLHHILKFNLRQNGFLSSLPYLILVFTNPLSGCLADGLRGSGMLSTKNTRKLVNSIGLFIPAILMLCVCFVDTDRNVIVALLTLAVGFSGFTMAGYSVNHLDIAPSFAGILFGVTNTIGTTTGFIGPAILGALTDGQNNKHQWIIFFYITSGIFFFGGIVFLFFAQGEPQNWGAPPVDLVYRPINDTEQRVPAEVQGDSEPGDPATKVKEDELVNHNEREWEALIEHRHSRRTAPVSSFSHVLKSF
ncbi:sialin-like [Physella acuta]|uniref:sialin-like n=1 Tax=Physella acuta TaxID=109671 RepID=UPI0027DB1BD5|nr:sialin-like [Physella acuta]XP_059171322.1 sialin-like [Physella acuta]